MFFLRNMAVLFALVTQDQHLLFSAKCFQHLIGTSSDKKTHSRLILVLIPTIQDDFLHRDSKKTLCLISFDLKIQPSKYKVQNFKHFSCSFQRISYIFQPFDLSFDLH